MDGLKSLFETEQDLLNYINFGAGRTPRNALSAINEYAAQQVQAERERIIKVIDERIQQHEKRLRQALIHPVISFESRGLEAKKILELINDTSPTN